MSSIRRLMGFFSTISSSSGLEESKEPNIVSLHFPSPLYIRAPLPSRSEQHIHKTVAQIRSIELCRLEIVVLEFWGCRGPGVMQSWKETFRKHLAGLKAVQFANDVKATSWQSAQGRYKNIMYINCTTGAHAPAAFYKRHLSSSPWLDQRSCAYI